MSVQTFATPELTAVKTMRALLAFLVAVSTRHLSRAALFDGQDIQKALDVETGNSQTFPIPARQLSFDTTDTEFCRSRPWFLPVGSDTRHRSCAGKAAALVSCTPRSRFCKRDPHSSCPKAFGCPSFVGRLEGLTKQRNESGRHRSCDLSYRELKV